MECEQEQRINQLLISFSLFSTALLMGVIAGIYGLVCLMMS